MNNDTNWFDAKVVKPELPLEPNTHYRTMSVLVTDGKIVTIGAWNSGKTGSNLWQAWCDYDDIKPDDITHWMPMPKAPEKKNWVLLKNGVASNFDVREVLDSIIEVLDEMNIEVTDAWTNDDCLLTFTHQVQE